MYDLSRSDPGSCWWCQTAPPDSDEHKWSKALVKRLYGSGSYGRDQLVHGAGDIVRTVWSAKAAVLTYRNSLCRQCNNVRSQPMDRALQVFFEYVLQNTGPIVSSQVLDLNDVFPNDTESSIDYLIRALAKDLGCRLVEAGWPIPQELRLLLDEGWRVSPILTVYFGINLGVLATWPSTQDFLGKSDLMATIGETDGELRAIGHSYNMSYLSCSVGYQWDTRVVNVDRLHPRKRLLHVSWGGVLSEDRLNSIREADTALGLEDVIDTGGNQLVNRNEYVIGVAGPAA